MERISNSRLIKNFHRDLLRNKDKNLLKVKLLNDSNSELQFTDFEGKQKTLFPFKITEVPKYKNSQYSYLNIWDPNIKDSNIGFKISDFTNPHFTIINGERYVQNGTYADKVTGRWYSSFIDDSVFIDMVNKLSYPIAPPKTNYLYIFIVLFIFVCIIASVICTIAIYYMIANNK